MKEHIKIYTGTAILVNRLAHLLDLEKIPSLIKNFKESSRLGGFGTTGDSVELHIFNSDKDKAQPIIEKYIEEISK